MEDKLATIFAAARLSLRVPSEATAFMSLVQKPGKEISQVSDSICFESSDIRFRFDERSSAEEIMDLLAEYFGDRSDAPELCRKA